MSHKKINNPEENNVLKKKLKLLAKKFTALGSIIVFLSWIFQNFYQEKWHSEVTRLERKNLALSLNEINKNIYQTFLNIQQSHMEADSNYDGTMQYAYTGYTIYANVLHHLGVTMSTDDEDFLEENETTYQNNKDSLALWIKNRETEKLAIFAQGLSDWETKNGSNTVKNYQIHILEIREKEEMWNKIYLALYILSACCLAYAFIIDFRYIKKYE